MATVNSLVASARSDSHTIAFNSVALIVRQAALWGLNAVLIVFLPRYLGDEGLGQLQFAASFTYLFSVGITLGAGQFLIKEVARDGSRAAYYMGTAIGTRILAGILILSAILVVAQISGLSGTARWVIYLAAATMMAHAFARLMAAFLQGFENMTAPATAEVAGKAFVVAMGIVVLVTGQGVVAYAAVLVGGALVQFAVNAGFLWRRVPIQVHFDMGRAKTLLLGGLPFLLMGFLIEIYNNIDVVMLRIYTRESVVGWYAAANQIYRAVELFPIALTTALLPTLSRIHRTNAHDLPAVARKSIVAIGLIIVPLAAGLALLSKPFISFLPYPDAFQNSVPVLTLLAMTIPATAFLTMFGTIAIATDRQKVWAYALLSTVLLNVAGNAVAIPYFQAVYGNGGTGAAITTLGCETFMVIVGLTLVPRGVMNAATVGALLKIGLATAIMMGAGIAAMEAGLGTLLVVGVAAAVYLSLVLATKALTKDDIAFLWDAVTKRLKNNAGAQHTGHQGPQ